MIDNKIPCKTCICFALCKSKKSLSSIVVECNILEDMWISINLYTWDIEEFLDRIKDTFNKI